MIASSIISHLSKDPVMHKVIEENTLSLEESRANVYQDLIRSITGQQLSVKVAKVIYDRFLKMYDGFTPSPDTLANASPAELRAIGYSKMKANYIINVAEYFKEVNPAIDFWSELEEEEIVEKLTTIKGVGTWTAQMIMIFTLDKRDIMPVADYGIQVAMKNLYQLKGEKKEVKQNMIKIAEKWRPYRSIACRYLWSSLNNTPK